jgi:hypothetical protein
LPPRTSHIFLEVDKISNVLLAFKFEASILSREVVLEVSEVSLGVILLETTSGNTQLHTTFTALHFYIACHTSS